MAGAVTPLHNTFFFQSRIQTTFDNLCTTSSYPLDCTFYQVANSFSCRCVKMREIVTLQLGHLSNYAATHFWNAQVTLPLSLLGHSLLKKHTGVLLHILITRRVANRP